MNMFYLQFNNMLYVLCTAILLPPEYRGIVINKICPWKVTNSNPSASPTLASSNHQQCSGPQSVLFPPGKVQCLHLIPQAKKVSWLHNFSQYSLIFQVKSSSLAAWLVVTATLRDTVTTNSLIPKNANL